MDSKIPVEISENNNMKKFHQTVFVIPGKMTGHLQIKYIIEKSHPHIKDYKEQVRY